MPLTLKRLEASESGNAWRGGGEHPLGNGEEVWDEDVLEGTLVVGIMTGKKAESGFISLRRS